MARSEKAPTQETVKGLFASLMVKDANITTVSQFVTSGKRWDLTQKELADKVIVLHRYTDINTQYGAAYLVDIDTEGEQRTLLVGGEVLMSQLVELAEHLPCVAVIRKPGRSYVFTDATPDEIAAYAAAYLSEPSVEA